MAVGGIISAIVVGLIIGALARLAIPGRQSMPIWLTWLVGIAGALIGSFLAKALGVETTRGVDWIEILLQVIVAAVGVALIAGSAGGRRGRSIL